MSHVSNIVDVIANKNKKIVLVISGNTKIKCAFVFYKNNIIQGYFGSMQLGMWNLNPILNIINEIIKLAKTSYFRTFIVLYNHLNFIEKTLNALEVNVLSTCCEELA